MNADPRREGHTYLSGYWRQTYTVLRVAPDGWLTVLWADGTTTTHCTAWDPRDREVTREVTTSLALTSHDTAPLRAMGTAMCMLVSVLMLTLVPVSPAASGTHPQHDQHSTLFNPDARLDTSRVTQARSQW